MTEEKLAELEALEATARPGEWLLRHNARDLFAALREAWRERDEARAAVDHAYREGGALYAAKIAQHEAEQERDEAVARCEKLRELADVAAGEQGLAQHRMLEAQRARDEARTEYRTVADAMGLVDWSDCGRCNVATPERLVAEVQSLRLAERERDEARAALRLLWEEATDSERCSNEASAGLYQHRISEPCRAAVKAAMGGE